MESFDAYRAKFSAIYEAVKRAHAASPRQHHGHGLDHDAAVAQMAAFIAPTTHLAEMGWVAALIHSTDRLVGDEACAAQVRDYLHLIPQHIFTDKEIEDIYLAVLQHSEKFPSHQCPVQEILQDADKLVNMQATVLIRVGQFQPDIPAIELLHLEKKNPLSSYQAPRSVLDDIRIKILEYPELIRTEKGKIYAAAYAKRLDAYAQQVLEDHTLLGLTGIEF